MITGGNPAPLGLVTVTAAGTPEKITKNFADMALAGIMRGAELAAQINFMPSIENSGSIYIGRRDMDKSDPAQPGVLFKLAAGQGWALQSPQGNIYNVHDLYIDADNNGESCYVSYSTV